MTRQENVFVYVISTRPSTPGGGRPARAARVECARRHRSVSEAGLSTHSSKLTPSPKVTAANGGSNFLCFVVDPLLLIDLAPTLTKTMIWVAATLLLATFLGAADALTTPQLRERSIYQVVTDRFERADGENAYCDPVERRYCGGGWKGIERRLGYIQGMGFDTSKPASLTSSLTSQSGSVPSSPISLGYPAPRAIMVRGASDHR